MLHVCYVLGCPVGKYGSNCENNCTCPNNAQDGCEKNSGNCTCVLGKTGENCKEGKHRISDNKEKHQRYGNLPRFRFKSKMERLFE